VQLWFLFPFLLSIANTRYIFRPNFRFSTVEVGSYKATATVASTFYFDTVLQTCICSVLWFYWRMLCRKLALLKLLYTRTRAILDQQYCRTEHTDTCSTVPAPVAVALQDQLDTWRWPVRLKHVMWKFTIKKKDRTTTKGACRCQKYTKKNQIHTVE
jgi:hypothetical protein